MADAPEIDRVPVKRALVSVYDKSGLEELVRGLHAAGVELVSTGGSAALIEGLFRQLVQDVDTRTLVIALTALMWLAYFGLVGRRRGTSSWAGCSRPIAGPSPRPREPRPART